MVTSCYCYVEAVLAGLMDVVCVLWSSRDAEIQAQENIRVQLELQAAKTSLLLFKVVGLPASFSQVCRIYFILFADNGSKYRSLQEKKSTGDRDWVTR
jgi:hypothetical protein